MTRELLIVNDDATQLRLAARLLERDGFVCHCAVSAEEGLRLLSDHPGVLGIITDLHMPGIDGWRFCRMLRSPSFEAYNRLPILVMSATFSGDDATRLTEELGANAFLSAPYRPRELRRLVGEILDGRTPAASLRVLLVQNDTPQAARTTEAFSAHGYTIVVARRVESAKRRLKRHMPGMVVIDYRMPDGTALDLLPCVKQPGSAAVAIVTTAAHQPELALELFKAGADGYVRETYDPEYVITLCERARRQRALLRVEELLEERTQRLRESEARLAAVFEAIPDIVMVYDPSGRVLLANPAGVHAFGNPVGYHLREFVAEPDRHLGARQRFETNYRGLRVEVTATPIRFGGRDATLAIARDVTERKRTEEELGLLAAALEHAEEMFVVTSADGIIRYTNPAFERITGYGREEALGAQVSEIHGSEHWTELAGTLAEGRSWVGRQTRHRRDGTEYVSEGSVSPVRDTAGVVRHFVGVERDVSAEVEMEHALRQAQKMEAVGTLAGGLAHDFNNLLTGILGYANLVCRLAPPDSEIRQMAQVIEGSAERATQLTRQLLGFARRGKNRDIPVNLEETIGRVVRLLSRTLPKHITIRKSLHEAIGTVMCDPAQIEQALLNLALNARDAMAEQDQGTLMFQTDVFEMDARYCARHPGSQPGDYVVLCVQDDGCGIDEEHRERIFEPFFTTKEQGKGTGMGLSMVYGIVKNHGGTIRVYSEPGRGTSFRIYLPRASAPPQREPVADQAEVVRGTGRILIVDDEEVVRNTASSMIKTLGYDVVALGDGDEAVLYYRHFGDRIDLVMIDMVMPGLDGRGTLKQLLELDPDVRCLLTTGFGLNDEAQRILDEGALGFMQKPYKVVGLSQTIASMLAGSGQVVRCGSRPGSGTTDG